MNALAANSIRELENLLRQECKLYQQYIIILHEERGFITQLNPEQLTRLTERRAALYDQMLLAQDRRLEIMRQFPSGQGQRLRDLISNHCTVADKQVLMPLVEKLKALVEEARTVSKEQSQILRFGLKLAHGIMSLFWSATQNVVKSYSRQGTSKEKFNATSRNANLLKRA